MKIFGTDIHIVKGDTISVTLAVQNQDGTQRKLAVTDQLHFTVKKSAKDTSYIIPPTLLEIQTEGNAVLTISAALTNIEPGTYFYDIQLKDAAGYVSTVVPKSKFVVEEAITDV